jgi:signal transduction histidine kinase
MDDAIELIGGAVHNLRALITDLRPAALDELGLAAALESLADRLETRDAIAVDLDVDLDWEAGRAEARPPAEVEAGVYRLVQEALNNIAKHAQVKRAHVRVAESAGAMVVEVRDEGVGFEESGAEAGFGLVGMRERVNMLGGEISIQSRPAEGTAVVARIPSWRGAGNYGASTVSAADGGRSRRA